MESLTERARMDLACLNFPPANWVPPANGPDGKPMLDALVVGGGMCGQTAAFALLREGVRNLRPAVAVRVHNLAKCWADCSSVVAVAVVTRTMPLPV